MPREGADGESSREAAGEVVPEHLSERGVSRNGGPSVTGEGRESAHERVFQHESRWYHGQICSP